MPGGTNVMLDEASELDAQHLRDLLALPGKHWKSKAIRFALHYAAANYRPSAEERPRCPDCEEGIVFSEDTCPPCKGTAQPLPVVDLPTDLGERDTADWV